jgi:hypothetical protein
MADSSGTSTPPVSSSAAAGTPTPTPAPSDASVVPSSSSSSVSLTVGTSTMRLTEKSFSITSWPKDLTLDLHKDNWREWNTRVRVTVKRQGFLMFLDGTLKCPDEATSPDGFWVWHHNDTALQGFLQHSLSPTDLTLTTDLPTAHAMYASLRNRHEKRGPFAQLLLLKEYLDIFFDDDTPFDHTCSQIEELHERICNMGPFDDDKLLTFGYLHALGDKYMHLQSTIQIQSTHPNFDAKSVRHLLDAETRLKRNQKKSAVSTPSNPIALAASTNPTRPPRAPCGNCKRTNHSTDYCVHPGGKLAGKTIEEAQAIQASHRLANMTNP